MTSSSIEPKNAVIVFKDDSITFKLVLSLKNSYFGRVERELEAILNEDDKIRELRNLLHAVVLNTCKHAIVENKKENLEDQEIIDLMDVNIYKIVKDDLAESALVRDLRLATKIKLCLFDELYIVRIQKQMLVFMELPEAIFTDTFIEPNVIKPFEFKQRDFGFKWFKSKDEVEWLPLSSSFTLIVTKEEFGYYIKLQCLYKANGGGLYEFISDNVVSTKPVMPTECPFQSRQEKTKNFLKNKFLFYDFVLLFFLLLTSFSFRVVSYNILSKRYTNTRFQYCPPEYLSIYYRKDLILKEVLGYKADIICLQEVDEDIAIKFYMNEFRKNGYDAILNIKNEFIPEGILTLYNTKRLSLIDVPQKIVFKNIIRQHFLKHVWDVMQEDKETRILFTRKAQIAHILKLEIKGSNEILIVINTHLYFDFDGSQVRLFQVICCLEYLKLMLLTGFDNKRIHVLFCGDFNSEPTSDVYKFITEGSIQYNNKIKSKMCTTTFHHPFNFKDVYTENNYTNFTKSFKDCIDYIFYSSCDLVNKLPLYDTTVLSENVALPSPVFPSDHISLVADLNLV